jgi:hypothetical protein
VRRLLPALLVVLVAGCGSDDKPTTVVQTQTVTQAVNPRVERAPKAPPKPKIVTSLTSFTSPTRNIGCYIDRTSVRCDIAKHDWKPPPKPKNCDLDWGGGIGLSRGRKPSIICAGDTALNQGHKLAYGKAIAAGRLRCDSKATGMTCRNTKTGRGFTLSRQAYKLF